MPDKSFIHFPTACYGETSQRGEQPAGVSDWECQRCAQKATPSDCCLCLLRGGALKKTEMGRWAHLVCAVTIPEVSLGDATTKEPVVTEGLTRSRRKLVSV